MDELTVEPVQDDVEIETSGEQSDVFAVRISLEFFLVSFFFISSKYVDFQNNYLS